MVGDVADTMGGDDGAGARALAVPTPTPSCARRESTRPATAASATGRGCWGLPPLLPPPAPPGGVAVVAGLPRADFTCRNQARV